MATTPDDLKSTPNPESLKEYQELLDRLDEYAGAVLSSETDRLRRSHLLRLYADEIGCPITEKSAATILAKAQGQVVGIYEPRRKGERMDTTPAPWVWEGIVMAGTFNLLVAPPKVGKSALMVGMIAAWWKGEQQYLGQTLHGVCPPVFIIGTDQPENDWFTLFKREGLVDESGNLGGPVEMLWHTGAPLHLTPEGIQHLAEVASKNVGAFFLLDSYHACVSPLAIDESTSAFDGPARDLSQALAPHQATLVMIHHTNKSVAGGNATNASRGSNALPAAASLTILMNWLKQPAEGQTQNDYRVVLKTQGRAKGSTLLAELKDDGWVSLGDGVAALQAEAMADAERELAGRQADVFDYIVDRWSLGQFPVASSELCAHFNLERNKIARCLSALAYKGLIHQVGETAPGNEGGRPAGLFAPCTPSLLEASQTSQTSQTLARAYERRGLSPLSPLSPHAGGGGFVTLAPGTPVERLIDGSWRNGWVVVDGSDPHAITIAKTGQMSFRIRNLRWEIDLRPSASPYPYADNPDHEPSTAAGTPADSFRRTSPSLLLDAHRALDEAQHHQGDQHQIPKGNGADQQNQRWPAGVGATRHHHPSVHGTVPDDW